MCLRCTATRSTNWPCCQTSPTVSDSSSEIRKPDFTPPRTKSALSRAA
jgi:hypothetical protein